MNIRKMLGIKRKYNHSYEYKLKKVIKYSLMYGRGYFEVDWIKPWQFWKKGWYGAYISHKE